MLAHEINLFAEYRYELRAYLCYLFQRNISNNLPQVELSKLLDGLEKIKGEISLFHAMYVLDRSGTQVIECITDNFEHVSSKGMNFNDRAYFYRAVKEKKCVLTDPYPSRIKGVIVVTAAYPVYNEAQELQYVVCMDLPFDEATRIVNPTATNRFASSVSKAVYGVLSLSLLAVTMLLFLKGLVSTYDAIIHFNKFEIKDMFEATILLTLSLAIFDLVKAIFEEEVLGRHKKDHNSNIHSTMIRFLGSIIIAISIEALMLVFKFTLIDPDKIVYAVYLIGGVMMLLIGLAFYVRSSQNNECCKK